MRSYFNNSRIVLLLIPVLAFSMQLLFGVHDPGVSPDSIEYISSAVSLGDDGGLYTSFLRNEELVPQIHFPPGLPFVLYLFQSFCSGDILFAAGLLNAFLLSISLWLIGMIVSAYRPGVRAIAVQVFVLTALSFYRIYMMVWSEPLFITEMLLYVLLFVRYFRNRSLSVVILAGLVAGCMYATRYIGVAFVVLGVFTVFFQNGFRNRFAWKDTFIFGFTSILIPLTWLIRNSMVTSMVSDRGFSYHPMGKEHLAGTLADFQQFFFQIIIGNTISFAIGALIILILLMLFVRQIRKRDGANGIGWIVGPALAAYAGLLIISNTFFDFTPIYFRITTPFMLMVLLWLIGTDFEIQLKNRRLKIVGVVCITIYAIFHVSTFLSFRMNDPQPGDYFIKALKDSELINVTANLNSEVKPFTNEPDRYYFATSARINHGRFMGEMITSKVPDTLYVCLFNDGRDYRGPDSTYILPAGINNYEREVLFSNQEGELIRIVKE